MDIYKIIDVVALSRHFTANGLQASNLIYIINIRFKQKIYLKNGGNPRNKRMTHWGFSSWDYTFDLIILCILFRMKYYSFSKFLYFNKYFSWQISPNDIVRAVLSNIQWMPSSIPNISKNQWWMWPKSFTKSIRIDFKSIAMSIIRIR